MKFLVDNALSPAVTDGLRRKGLDAKYVRDRGLQSGENETIFELARVEGRVLVSADTDIGTMLALSGARTPSVVPFRRGTGCKPETQAAILLSNLPKVKEALEAGSVVVLEDARIRIRRLPIGDEES